MAGLASREQSKVLILTICSNTKLTSGETRKSKITEGIINFLPAELITLLYGARYQVRALITSDKVSRDGKSLRDMPFNADLIDGPEFNGKRLDGRYKPAIQRYNGRFYRSLGTKEDRGSLAHNAKHHLLIISGLYGIVTPLEPIQCYSCHITDDASIVTSWTNNDLLTKIILSYINQVNIVRVFDFTADSSYRNLISWELVRHAIGNNVLHCFSEQFAGPAILPSLGLMAKEMLTRRSEDELLRIEPYDKIKLPDDEINFLPNSDPTFPLAREIEQLKIETKDKIARIRRNYIKIIKAVTGDTDYFGGFIEKCNRLRSYIGKHEPNIVEKLQKFNSIRNIVEYSNHNALKDWPSIMDDYIIIINWAKEKNYTKNISLEKVQ